MVVEDFYKKDCDKIDAHCVNAYFDLSLDPADPSTLIFDNSWGTIELDLTPAVKNAETVTELHLAPENSDVKTALAYHREDGEVDCIEGDDLSRIISMTLLKDVDQTTEITDGDVYIYNEETNKFEPYDLKTTINNINSAITTLQNQVESLDLALSQLTQRVTHLEELLTPPADAPSNIKVTWGNINLYSDNTNANLKTSGLYTHLLSENRTNDEYFA